MTGPELKAVEGDLLREVLSAFVEDCHPDDDPDGTWPVGMCDSTCEILLAPEEEGGFDWGGRYGLRWRSGGFRGEGSNAGHAWLAAEDGTIVDPTVGQFVPGPALRVILPGDPIRACFTGWDEVEDDDWRRVEDGDWRP